MNRVRSARAAAASRTGCGGAKKVKVCSPEVEKGNRGAKEGRGANDRGGAAPAAATARKLMPAPSAEPLLPASDAAYR